MKPTKSLYDKGPNDLEFKINSLEIENENLKRINQKLTNDIVDLQKKLNFVVEEYRNKGTL
jgi:predicted RNase H-like nuclease (RuvC/YqgF family)